MNGNTTHRIKITKIESNCQKKDQQTALEKNKKKAKCARYKKNETEFQENEHECVSSSHHKSFHMHENSNTAELRIKKTWNAQKKVTIWEQKPIDWKQVLKTPESRLLLFALPWRKFRFEGTFEVSEIRKWSLKMILFDILFQRSVQKMWVVKEEHGSNWINLI